MSGWAAVAQAGMEIGGAFLNNRFAESLQHQSQDFSAQQYANRYQIQVEDLKKAGLNPMLAYMQSPGSSPSVGIASAAKANMGTAVGAYNETRLASAQEAQMESQAQKNTQDAKTSAAQERNLDADTLVKGGLSLNLAAELVQIRNSAEQTHWTTEKIKAEIPVVMKQLEEINSKIKLNKSSTELNQSQALLNQRLRELKLAEMYLTGSINERTKIESNILRPKERASSGWSAEAGHIADNIGKIGSAAWKFMFPSFTSPTDLGPTGGFRPHWSQ